MGELRKRCAALKLLQESKDKQAAESKEWVKCFRSFFVPSEEKPFHSLPGGDFCGDLPAL